MNELYTVREVSKRLRCNVDRVYALINAGLLPAIKLGTLKVPASDLDEFIQTYTGKDVTDPWHVTGM